MAAEVEPRRQRTVPFFFFGTLMDADVLGEVLARPVAAAELQPAMLWGYRRHAVIGAVYPVIRQDRDRHVRGRLFQPRSGEEQARIDHFEDAEYEPAPVRVQVDTRIVEAVAYRDLEDVFMLSDEHWCFERFLTHEKQRYLEACTGWMEGYASAA